ncbi:SMP-30/gluconolactonase/LRE family protein [Pontibacter pamirensis]|uniref:SMP-30/gluconolactonase/LRE family protein n=1 Tax=Pontibacter pamirensis TaxID=2562824 RepID=UPI001F17CE0D|nr:SMP-30/gluconolactonase/LRE family protein [Pontibacter pamirensis]
MGVYRIDKDGSVHLVAANVAKPNGIAISPDQKTLYVANCDQPGDGNSRFLSDDIKAVRPTGEGYILAYNLLPDGSLQFRGKLIDYGTSCPDGLAVDREGNLYIGVWERLEVYSPKGKKIAEIKVPEAVNMCFGRGRFSKTLFIAGGKSIYAIDVKKEGYNVPYKK